MRGASSPRSWLSSRPRLVVLVALALALPVLLSTVALAVHEEGLFELDENAVDETYADPRQDGDDWDLLEGGGGSALAFTFIEDGFEGDDPAGDPDVEDDVFAKNSKDIQDITSWWWKDAEPEDKNDIEHAYAAAYEATDGDLILYFGIDRMANNGDAALGMWFLQAAVSQLGDGEPNDQFSGAHTPGDVLVQTDFTTGGTIERIDVYMWDCDTFFGSAAACAAAFTPAPTLVGGDLWRVFQGQDCDADPLGGSDALACGQVNTTEEDASWIDDGYEFKCVGNDQPADCQGLSGVQPSSEFGTATFFEGGVNLTELGLTDVCLAEIVAESRSSQSETSTLDDKALGEFNLCGALRIQKQSTKGTNPLVGGATFEISPDPTDGVGVLSITDNDANDEDPVDGKICIFPVPPGTYSVEETDAPAGYGDTTSTNPQTGIVVPAGSTCTSTDPAAPTVTFLDPPLADIQVRFRDGGSGETFLSVPISCDNTTGTSSTDDTTGWDDTLTVTGVEAPTTIVCTIVIDP